MLGLRHVSSTGRKEAERVADALGSETTRSAYLLVYCVPADETVSRVVISEQPIPQIEIRQ